MPFISDIYVYICLHLYFMLGFLFRITQSKKISYIYLRKKNHCQFYLTNLSPDLLSCSLLNAYLRQLSVLFNQPLPRSLVMFTVKCLLKTVNRLRRYSTCQIQFYFLFIICPKHCFVLSIWLMCRFPTHLAFVNNV
jgi:hypothetical protein